MVQKERLIQTHGGYRHLKSFQMAQLVYDVTVRFCDRYVDRFSRTKDQMVQAARSGVQNIAEGSLASATSRKTELRLTQVARASLEELKLDYEDFLRHRGLPLWERSNPLRQELIDRRCRTANDVARWIMEVCGRRGLCGPGGPGGLDGPGAGESGSTKSTPSTQSTRSTKKILKSTIYPEYSANAALVLLTVACVLLERQVAHLARSFEAEGGFTERLYRVRTASRKKFP